MAARERQAANRDAQSANEQAHAAWNALAEFWDEHMGDEGNAFHQLLIGPNVERLLALRPGERVLDVACGTGYFARRLAELGADVVGVDFSEAMLERARERLAAAGANADLRLVDATDEAQLLALGERSFDAACSNMALMDMAEIEPLMRALARLLRPGGRFVFSVTHPVFNSGNVQMLFEAEDRDGEWVETRSVKVWDYLEPTAKPGLGIVDQPVPGYYMHRPLSLLLQPAFDAGLVLDALEEPVYPPDFDPPSPPHTHSWANYPLIPPALIARLRLPG